MTVLELIYEFNINEPDVIDTDTILYYLNKAQDSFVENRHNGPNKTYEQTQKLTDDLRTLVTTKETTGESITELEFPSDYIHLLRIEGKGSFKNCQDVDLKLSPHQQDDIREVIRDPFNKPLSTDVIYIYEDNKLKFLKDSDTKIEYLKMVYLKKPKKMTVGEIDGKQFQHNEYTNDCELPVGTHREILNLALAIYRKQINEFQINE